MAKKHKRRPDSRGRGRRQKPAQIVIPSLAQICESPNDFLGKIDVAALNLMCAVGLPQAEKLDFDRCLSWLDEAARKADFDTRRHLYRFIQSPGTYNNSPGYFCCYHLLQALQEDFGVRYNPARVRDPKFQDPKCLDPDFKDSRDLFIHGIIDGPGGTCASMPVLYVAAGRRLGYPLKLVEARGHLFVRWDDPLGKRLGVPEVFNIEGAGEGIASYPDDHYRTWPEPWTDADRAGGWYLKSLTPAEEFAAFLCTRAECLTDNGRIAEAIQAYRWACGLAPQDARYRAQLMCLERKSIGRLLELQEVIAMSRANRERLLPGPPGLNVRPIPPPHGDSCCCVLCQGARANSPAAPHGQSCQCLQCRQARGAARPRQSPLGHPSTCTCNLCSVGHGRGSTPGSPFPTRPSW